MIEKDKLNRNLSPCTLIPPPQRKSKASRAIMASNEENIDVLQYFGTGAGPLEFGKLATKL